MEASFLQTLLFLAVGISVIVVLTARFRVHAFFALLISCFIVGLGVQLSVSEIITATKDGFGNVMKSLGLIIVLGTALGVILEHTGSTQVMASYILRKVGVKRAPLAMNITGFIVGLPIFCDSGYIVLNGLNQSLARRTGIPVVIMATSLATGLYSVHCLIPPHPGAAAAAGIIGVDFGTLILVGGCIAIPASAVGYLWAKFAGKKSAVATAEVAAATENPDQPSVLKSFLPVIIPILLIALRSFSDKYVDSKFWKECLVVGDPVIALSIGVLLALNGKRGWTKEKLGSLLQDAAEKAGGILVIIGAGGAFGAVLAATNIGGHLSGSLDLGSLGILFPFLLTALLKTAQGSSTVAIITSASIIAPLMPSLMMDKGNGPLFCVLSMGAGSMMVSHANDAYFWVIARFSGLEMKEMLRVYTVASILMGLTAFLVTWLVWIAF
ncbi:GntP family permease [Flavihumibacter solisilvae]|uniref:Gluconate transporter n=1 Tax=Flavihumibacter solisilvae TaxID=1349421 RepID=A0A0C1L269_9BACT|nr:GntP family permease [Flavihumibacter solisilvae]KIC93696.1 gluconate transporter [Flavihumibacter solisilvae]